MTADTVGGVWTYVMNLCSSFLGRNFEFHLATMGRALSNHQCEQVESLPNITLYESEFKLEWMENPGGDLAEASEWLVSLYKAVKPDVIHFNNFGQVASYPWECPVVTVFHSCVETWWLAVKGERAPAESRFYHKIVQSALASSDLLIAPSESILVAASEVYNMPRAVKVIYNGIPPMKPSAEKHKIIASAGRIWDEAKNMHLLADVSHRLPWQVIIAGEGKLPEIQTLKVLGQVAHNKVAELLAMASIFVTPAKYEPFGLAVLEAAASRCALALADIPTFREIWGDAAVFFDPTDKQSAVSAIRLLTDDNEFRNEMASKAELKSAEFSIERMSKDYWELYENLHYNIIPTI